MQIFHSKFIHVEERGIPDTQNCSPVPWFNALCCSSSWHFPSYAFAGVLCVVPNHRNSEFSFHGGQIEIPVFGTFSGHKLPSQRSSSCSGLLGRCIRTSVLKVRTWKWLPLFNLAFFCHRFVFFFLHHFCSTDAGWGSEVKDSTESMLLQCYFFSAPAAFCDHLDHHTQSQWFQTKTLPRSVRAAILLWLALRKPSPCLSDSTAPKDSPTTSHSSGEGQMQSTAAWTQLEDGHSPLTSN